MQYFSYTLRFVSILIALNYFAFRVELFEEESEANQPGVIPTQIAFSTYSVNWETFDKDNAPKAFVVNVDPTIEIIFLIPPPVCSQLPNTLTLDIIRDKSPPMS
jgi:hypothetical protein